MEDEFEFYKNCDSIGYDLTYINEKVSTDQLKEICKRLDKCVSFNTFGYMKYHVGNIQKLPQLTNESDGLYVYKKRQEELSKKKKIAFYIGYTIMNEKEIYGSELALIKLCQQLSKQYDVYVFGKSCQTSIIRGILFVNADILENFMNNNVIDVMIISRYIHYFVEYPIKAKKTYIWLHDTQYLSQWNGQFFPDRGKHIVNNVFDNIAGIVTLTEWHRKLIIETYDVSPPKVHIIGNAIDNSFFKNEDTNTIEKIPYRFIYTSDICRGLEELVDYFEDINKEFPLAELYVYRGLRAFDNYKPLLERINNTSYIHYGGKLTQEELMKEFMKSEIWLYPTWFTETYCMSGLEAQRSGCYCIATKLAALSEIIGDRGVLIDGYPKNDNIKQLFLSEVRKALTNDELRKTVQSKGKEWAKNQSWELVGSQWMNLINGNN
ncbi:MAG: glycosyltransferase [Nitrososphaeraceae archaeon]|nr:glycosyltransferase [Nitrososphaeraceae archaeon]